jgi:hypothetical protein
MKISYAALVLAVSGVSACGASTGKTSAPGATTPSPCRVGYMPQDSCLTEAAPATAAPATAAPATAAPATAAPTTAAPSPSHRRSGTIGTGHTVTIATFTGNGDTSTSQFTIRGNGNWVLKYSYDCSAQPGGEGIFIVDEDAMNNDTPSAVAIDRLDSGGKGSWHVYGDAGRHYLEILTECPYTISVLQQY